MDVPVDHLCIFTGLPIKTAYCRRKDVIYWMSDLCHGRDGSIWKIATAIEWTLEKECATKGHPYEFFRCIVN